MKNCISTWTILTAAFSVCALSSCSNDETAAGNDGIRVAASYTDAPEAGYTHTIALYKDAEFVEKKTGATASFAVDKDASVSLRVVAASNANANFGTYLEDKGVGLFEVTDFTDVPDILFGVSSAATISATQSLAVNMERVMSKITFTHATTAAITSLTATVKDVCTKVSPMNKKGIALATANQTIALTDADQDGVYAGSSFIVPTGNGVTSFSVEYNVTFGDGSTKTETTTIEKSLNANQELIVTVGSGVKGQSVEATAGMDVDYANDPVQF